MNLFKRLTMLLISCCLLVLAGCAATSTSEGTGEYVDDTVITSKVKAEIFNDAVLKSREINVETFKGVVQLSGFVASAADSSKAAGIARGIKGVKAVRNDILIK